VNGHKFGFNRGNIHNLEAGSFDYTIILPDVSNRYCSIGFLDATICNDGSAVGVNLRLVEYDI